MLYSMAFDKVVARPNSFTNDFNIQTVCSSALKDLFIPFYKILHVAKTGVLYADFIVLQRNFFEIFESPSVAERLEIEKNL
jgi:hypothetical protein